MVKLVVTTLIVLLLGGAAAPGQQWLHRDSVWREKLTNNVHEPIRDAGLKSIVLHSPERYHTLLQRFVYASSTDSAAHLLELPLNKTAYGDAEFYVSTRGYLFGFWDGFNNNAHRLFVKPVDSVAWTEVYPGDMPLHQSYFMYSYDTTIFVVSVFPGDLCSYSSNFGKTWDVVDMGSLGYPSPTKGFRNAFNVNDTVVACWRNNGFREWSMTTATQSHPSLPTNTGIYVRIGRRVIGSTVFSDAAHPARIFVSADSGVTWSFIDTVKVANTGLPITPDNANGRAFECTHIHRLGDSTLVMTTEGRNVLITTDAGVTWRACSGYIDTFLTRWGLTHENYWFDLSDTVMLVGLKSDLYTINVPQCSVTHRHLPMDAVSSITMLKNGELMCPANPAVYSSRDTGSTWTMMPWPEGATWNESLGGTTNVSHAFINTVRPHGTDSVDVYSVDCGQVLRLYPGSDRRAKVLSGDWLLSKLFYSGSNSDQTIWTSYLDVGQCFTKLGSDSMINTRPTSMLRVGSRQDSLPTPTGNGRQCFYATILSRTERWVQQDSLYRSPDDGLTWKVAETGLPRYTNGMTIPVSSIIRLQDETLLCSLRGLRKATLSDTSATDTSIIREGGIWRSSNDGKTWERSDAGLEYDRYVWWLSKLSSGTLLAVAGNMLFDARNNAQEVTGWNLGGARIFRSNDNGRTWSVVYAESRDRTAYPGRRPILQTKDGRILAATMENGMIESGDDGQTWHEVGEELYGRIINDIDEDSTGTIWVATDNGIWSWQRTTPVDEPYVNGKYTSVWAYPTPARNQIIVRLNNLNLQRTSTPHLYLYDISGVRRADLTDHVNANRSSERMEFPYSTLDLENGVYLLVLETTDGFETMKVCVFH